MRQFYIFFKNVVALPQQLTWSHINAILTIKEEAKRNYYINISVQENLSYRELRNRIKNNEYE